jgi:putative SOS response-associated peptidase YedK
MIKEMVIITKNSDGEISKLHDRMPVIIPENELEY